MATYPAIPLFGSNTVQVIGGLPSGVVDGSIYVVLSDYTQWVYDATNAVWNQVNPQGQYSAGNTSTALTISWRNGVNQSCTATGNVVFTLSNPKTGVWYTLKILQDGTGSRTYTWPAAVLWPGGSSPSGSGANKVDVIQLYYDGTNYFGRSSLNY